MQVCRCFVGFSELDVDVLLDPKCQDYSIGIWPEVV
jgi:hypothetical protein